MSRTRKSSGESIGKVGDGRERALLEHVLRTSTKDDPQSVLDVVDGFAKHTWLMNVGSQKGLILDAALRKRNPKVALELGAYCGYSAVRITSQLQQPQSLLISIEINPDNADIASQVVDQAGLSSKFKILKGTLSERIEDLKHILRRSGESYLEFVFVDHSKDFYLHDYLLLKNEGVIGPGTVIVADNMGYPGSPQFSAYLKNAEELETVAHKCTIEHMDWVVEDIVTVSNFKG